MVDFLNRYVSLEVEDAYNTDNGSANTEFFGEVDDESFATRMDLLTRQDMSHYGATKSVTGSEYSEGGYNMAVQVDKFMGATLLAFFPKYAYSAGTEIHSFDEPTAAADVYESFIIRVGRENKEHIYTGMVGNRLSVSANVGEYVMMSADWVGCREKAPGDLTNVAGDLSFDGDALDALYFSNGTVTFNQDTSTPTASATIKSISFEINQNRDTDNAYGLGDSTYRRAPPAQRREVTGTIEFNQVVYSDFSGIADTDEPNYTNLVAEDAPLGLYDDASEPAIKLTFQEETSGSDNYLEFSIWRVRFEAPEASVSGRDTNTMSLNFVALYDDSNDKMMSVAIKGGNFGTSAITWD